MSDQKEDPFPRTSVSQKTNLKSTPADIRLTERLPPTTPYSLFDPRATDQYRGSNLKRILRPCLSTDADDSDPSYFSGALYFYLCKSENPTAGFGKTWLGQGSHLAVRLRLIGKEIRATFAWTSDQCTWFQGRNYRQVEMYTFSLEGKGNCMYLLHNVHVDEINFVLGREFSCEMYQFETIFFTEN